MALTIDSLKFVTGSKLGNVRTLTPMPNRQDDKVMAIDPIWICEAYRERSLLGGQQRSPIVYDGKLNTNHYQAAIQMHNYDSGYYINPTMEFNPTNQLWNWSIPDEDDFRWRFFQKLYPNYDTLPEWKKPYEGSEPYPLSKTAILNLYDNMKRYTRVATSSNSMLMQEKTIPYDITGSYSEVVGDEAESAIPRTIDDCWYVYLVGRKDISDGMSWGTCRWEKSQAQNTPITYKLPEGVSAKCISLWRMSTRLSMTSQDTQTFSADGLHIFNNAIQYNNTTGLYDLKMNEIVADMVSYIKGLNGFIQEPSRNDPFGEYEDYCIMRYEASIYRCYSFLVLDLGDHTKWW